LPSKAGAERIAEALLTQAGFDLAGASVDAAGGTTDWAVAVTPAFDDVPLTVSAWSVSVGAEGVVESASGYLSQPVAAGDYPLVGVQAGVQRLKEGGSWIVFGGPGPLPMTATAGAGTSGARNVAGAVAGGPVTSLLCPGSSGCATTETAMSNPPTCTPGGPCSTPASPPVSVLCPAGAPCPTTPPATAPCGNGGSCETVPQPPPTVITVTGVHLGLAWASLADPTAARAWLVPVYVFELGDTGGIISVLAVTDFYLTPPSSTSVPSTVIVPSTVPPTIEPPSVSPQPSSVRPTPTT